MTLDGNQLNAILTYFGVQIATEIKNNQEAIETLKEKFKKHNEQCGIVEGCFCDELHETLAKVLLG